MTKKLFILCAALVWTVSLMAQKISVVSPEGDTKLYKTLQEAIEGAAPESVIYLPGGGFPIADNVKITKKLTIIGIGHTAKNGNVDGITLIKGSLRFYEGSSGSAVMACYITGNVNIGEGGASVNDVLIRYCNLNSVQVNNSTCQETVVNQNYIQNTSDFNGANGVFSNNVAHSLTDLDNGTITNNIFLSTPGNYGTLLQVDNSAIINNIFFSSIYGITESGYGNLASGNMTTGSWGDDPINVGSSSGWNGDWTSVFKDYKGLTPSSNFHFTDEYKQYEGKVGIYAGNGFNEKQTAPVPYIVTKHVDDQTDASGKLNIKIRVKASGEE